MLKKGDIFLVAFICIFILLIVIIPKFLKKNDYEHKVAIIKQGNKVIQEIDLGEITEPRLLEIDGEYSLIILIEKGRIRFKEASCPDKLCVKTGWISKPGDVAVCLPNQSMIKIKGKKTEIDGISY